MQTEPPPYSAVANTVNELPTTCAQPPPPYSPGSSPDAYFTQTPQV